MATLLENLIARRNAIGVELAALSASRAGGKPDASKAGIQHIAYKKSLYEELDELTKKIDALGGDTTNGGGTTFEIATVAET